MPTTKPQTAPSDIAREALRTLAQRRIAPTPNQYAQAYGEIAGHQDFAGVLLPRMLAELAARLAQHDEPIGSHGHALSEAIEAADWTLVHQHIDQLLDEAMRGPDWATLIRNLLRQWEVRHVGLTDARKRETLEHLFSAFGSDSSKLHPRLSSVLKSWSELAMHNSGRIDILQSTPVADLPAQTLALNGSASAGINLGANSGVNPNANTLEVLGSARKLLAEVIEQGVAGRLAHAPLLAAEARALAELGRRLQYRKDVELLNQKLRAFWYKLEMSGESQDRIIDSLSSLLRLMVRNMGELVADDGWVSGQVEQLGEMLDQPISERSLREVERSFRRVVYQQAGMKLSLDQAKHALKAMLTSFVDRLGGMAETTGSYHERIKHIADELARTEDIHRIGEIVHRLTQDTREMQSGLLRSHEALQQARKEAVEQQNKIDALEQQLVAISQLVREDALTHVLNRRGMEDALNAEVSRSGRSASPLCVGILDVDDFKLVNDRHGHGVGDEALVHLVEVVRRSLRPSDVIARYGGEEFVVLLPDTPLEEAKEVMVRTQRELTRQFFMHDNERLLITFSGGVAQHRAGDSPEETLDRADAALYLAKRQGKNQVVAVVHPLASIIE